MQTTPLPPVLSGERPLQARSRDRSANLNSKNISKTNLDPKLKYKTFNPTAKNSIQAAQSIPSHRFT